MKNLVLTLIFSEGVSLPLVRDITKDIASLMGKLDDTEPEIRKNL